MKSRSLNPSRSILSLLAFALILSLAIWSGCSNENVEQVTGPNFEKPSLELSVANPAVRAVMAVQDRHTPDLMARPGVVGTATSVDENGQPFIKVYTAERLPRGNVPASIDGVPVVAEVSGIIRAMKGKPGGGGGGGGKVDHKALQTAPVKMGTSGGWAYDLANGYCCGGTLGSLISRGGKTYVLSNYHVLEADIVNGGNNRQAQNGDPVIQPGLLDVNCNLASAQSVATLSGIKSLPNSNVDAAIAEVLPGMVDESGDILEVGVPSSQTVAASVGQKVKKSGRTTGLTRSTVDGLNATVSITYENECAGGTAFTKTFTGQIIIKNKGSRFLAGGDSGSLMLEDADTSPRAVGLLFAGSSSLAVANPIGEVLSYLNATMVGN